MAETVLVPDIPASYHSGWAYPKLVSMYDAGNDRVRCITITQLN